MCFVAEENIMCNCQENVSCYEELCDECRASFEMDAVNGELNEVAQEDYDDYVDPYAMTWEEAEAEMRMAQWDDDPNPYHGTY
jgi:hypothetical protein